MTPEFNAYLDSLQGKRIAVLGIGVSNRPLIRLLLKNGCRVTACDKTERVAFGEYADELERMGAELRLGNDYLDALDHDVIFRTPGLRPDYPQLVAARERGAEITSEMEAFFTVCPCRIIAVTGSDGKTTTTTIISELLKAAGKKVWLGGNIGKPLLAEAGNIRPDDFAVLELSSFQLMTMKRSPATAVVTNVAPNHLDWHRSMEEYTAAKRNIFLHQRAGDRLVLNYDNAVTKAFASEAVGEAVFFSRAATLENGWYFDGSAICFAANGRSREVVKKEKILLPGLHNIENYMAAFAAVRGVVSEESCRSVAERFAGVEHRIELVRRLRGVAYYNDSIASSPSRTIAGLRAFGGKKLILIAGGYDKHIPYGVLGPELHRYVKTLVLTGDTADKIGEAAETAGGVDKIIRTDDFTDAVLMASREAEPGDVVMLSPASASFDKFKNFMERGDTFKRIINGLE